ncbi:MAG: Gfo/Idh/MocA family oxidoreductase [Chlorobi bacterium]|nr:Gfo/Idh/MocA family oxidoreductase [Chlorobiota bacterium]
MKKTYRVALASFGMSGRVFHGPLLKAHPGFRVTYVLERSKSLSKKMFPDARIVRSWKDLPAAADVDIIVVNTPDHLHYAMIKDALLAGKHVVVEKPFTLHSAEADELISLAGKKKRILTVYQNRRWDGDFLTVKDILDKKLPGTVVDYEAHFDRYRPEPDTSSWKEDVQTRTSNLYNLGPHLIDQTLVLFGMPHAVFADMQVVRRKSRVFDYFNIRLFYDEPLRVTLKSSYMAAQPGPKYLIHGFRGSFLKYGSDPQEKCLAGGELPGGVDWGKENPAFYGWLILAGEKGKLHQKRYPTLPGKYQAFYENLYNALDGKEPLAVKPEEARDVVRIIEAALLSAEEKIVVEFE